MSTEKREHFVTIFLNAITTSATVAIAAAFETRSEPGTNIFPISPSVFANEVYGHKVKVENMKFSTY